MTASVTRLDTRRTSNRRSSSDTPRILGCLQWVRKAAEDGGPKATGSAKALLIYLASYADADGTHLRVGTDRIVAELGWSESTVKRARRKLIEIGELIVLVQGTGSRSTEYLIPLPVPVDNSGTRSSGGVNMTPPGGQDDPPRGVNMTPNRPDTDQIPEGALVDRCSAHRDHADPPPCRGCQKAREAVEARSREQARARAAEQQQQQRETELRETSRRATAASRAPLAAEARAEAEAARLARRASQNTTRPGTLSADTTKGTP